MLLATGNFRYFRFAQVVVEEAPLSLNDKIEPLGSCHFHDESLWIGPELLQSSRRGDNVEEAFARKLGLVLKVGKDVWELNISLAYVFGRRFCFTSLFS